MTAPTDIIETIAETGALSHGNSVSAPLGSMPSEPDDVVVVDDLPRPMQVMAKEADVVEMYLAALLDELLGKSRAASRQEGIVS
jgi:hypothetical protein